MLFKINKHAHKKIMRTHLGTVYIKEYYNYRSRFICLGLKFDKTYCSLPGLVFKKSSSIKNILSLVSVVQYLLRQEE